MKPIKAFIKPFEAPQRSAKIIIQVIFDFNTTFRIAREGKSRHLVRQIVHSISGDNSLRHFQLWKCVSSVSNAKINIPVNFFSLRPGLGGEGLRNFDMGL